MEWRVRRWAGRLPVATLTHVFEVESSMPALAATPRTPEEQAVVDARLAQNREDRRALSRWEPSARRRALAQ